MYSDNGVGETGLQDLFLDSPRCCLALRRGGALSGSLESVARGPYPPDTSRNMLFCPESAEDKLWNTCRS